MSAADVTLREVTDQNRDAVIALKVAPGQEWFVASVQESLADAAATPRANPVVPGDLRRR